MTDQQKRITENYGVPEITYDTIEVGAQILDPEDGRFGTVLSKDETDPEWRMLEVKWDRDEDDLDGPEDISHIVPGMQIGVSVELTTEDQMATVIDDIVAAQSESEDADADAVREMITGASVVKIMLMVEWD